MKASVLANLNANTGAQVGNLEAKEQITNMNEKNRTDSINTQNTNLERRFNEVREPLRYEQVSYTARDKTLDEIRNWLARNMKVRMNNYAQQRNMNTLTSLFDNVTVDENGRIVQNDKKIEFNTPLYLQNLMNS